MASEDSAMVYQSGARSISTANNHLALRLYRLLVQDDKNVFFSPFSLSTALAMLYCGTEGETAGEMRHVLGYEVANIKDDEVRSHFQCLLNTLEASPDFYTLSCANSVLSHKEFSIKNDFKALLEESFKALIQTVDFQNESEKARNQINDWVKEKTNNMIPQLLDSIDSATILLLLNAVYFKGFWLNKFKERDTFLQYFYNKGIEDNAKLVDMMHMKDEFPYAEKESFKALQLLYKGKDISMLVLLPNSRDGLAELESSLSSSFIQDLKQCMIVRKVEVALPKFRLEYSKSLGDQFQALGMKRAFRPGAHFGGISDTKNLLISEIVHKAVLDVNEEGSEAAAVTAVVMMLCSISFNPEFIVDHPFLFVIFNNETDLILFMGRVDEL